jgi:hypothetical protein
LGEDDIWRKYRWFNCRIIPKVPVENKYLDN